MWGTDNAPEGAPSSDLSPRRLTEQTGAFEPGTPPWSWAVEQGVAGTSRGRRGSPLTRSTAGASGLGRVALTLLDAAPVKELVRPLRPLLGLEPEPSGKPQGHWPCSDWGHPARLRSPPGPLWLWRTGRRGQGAAAAHRTAQEAAGRPLWGRGLSERSPAPHSPHAASPTELPTPSLPGCPSVPPGTAPLAA